VAEVIRNVEHEMASLMAPPGLAELMEIDEFGRERPAVGGSPALTLNQQTPPLVDDDVASWPTINWAVDPVIEACQAARRQRSGEQLAKNQLATNARREASGQLADQIGAGMTDAQRGRANRKRLGIPFDTTEPYDRTSTQDPFYTNADDDDDDDGV
jgi:hypothetical protein